MPEATIDRRTVIQGAAWAVPVIAAAIATPLAAASQPTSPTKANRLRFTNLTMTEGGEKNTLYFNTKIQVNGGQPVEQVMLTVSLSRDAETVTRTFPYIAGDGNSGIVELVFPGISKGSDVVATVQAWALNVETISGQVSRATPGWWN